MYMPNGEEQKQQQQQQQQRQWRRQSGHQLEDGSPMSKSLTRTTPSTNAERTANAPRACKREIDYMSSRIHEIVLFIEKNGLHPDSELQVDMHEIRLLKEKMPLLLKKMPSRVVAESPAGGVDKAVNGGENLALDYRSEQGDAVTPLDAEEQPPRWTGTSFGLLCCRENAAMDQWDEDTLPMLHAVQGDHVVQANKDMQQSGDTALEDGLEKKKTVEMEWDDGLSHGVGNYNGLADQGVPNGYGVMKWSCGKTFVGNWKNGQRDGQGWQRYGDGRTYMGDWQDGKPHGVGKWLSPWGESYQGELAHGKKGGTGTFIYDVGSTYSGEWLAGNRHGEGTRHYPDGSVYTGSWRDDVRSGQGVYTWEDGRKWSGYWSDGDPVHKASGDEGVPNQICSEPYDCIQKDEREGGREDLDHDPNSMVTTTTLPTPADGRPTLMLKAAEEHTDEQRNEASSETSVDREVSEESSACEPMTLLPLDSVTQTGGNDGGVGGSNDPDLPSTKLDHSSRDSNRRSQAIQTEDATIKNREERRLSNRHENKRALPSEPCSLELRPKGRDESPSLPKRHRSTTRHSEDARQRDMKNIDVDDECIGWAMGHEDEGDGDNENDPLAQKWRGNNLCRSHSRQSLFEKMGSLVRGHAASKITPRNRMSSREKGDERVDRPTDRVPEAHGRSQMHSFSKGRSRRIHSVRSLSPGASPSVDRRAARENNPTPPKIEKDDVGMTEITRASEHRRHCDDLLQETPEEQGKHGREPSPNNMSRDGGEVHSSSRVSIRAKRRSTGSVSATYSAGDGGDSAREKESSEPMSDRAYPREKRRRSCNPQRMVDISGDPVGPPRGDGSQVHIESGAPGGDANRREGTRNRRRSSDDADGSTRVHIESGARAEDANRRENKRNRRRSSDDAFSSPRVHIKRDAPGEDANRRENKRNRRRSSDDAFSSPRVHIESGARGEDANRRENKRNRCRSSDDADDSPRARARVSVSLEVIGPDGVGNYEGEVKDGRPHGQGRMKMDIGKSYEGAWVRGKWTGYGILAWEDGRRHEGHWVRNIPQGMGKMVFRNGSTYDGNFKNGVKHGQGVHVYECGDRYDGEWKWDLRHGQVYKADKRAKAALAATDSELSLESLHASLVTLSKGVGNLKRGITFQGIWTSAQGHRYEGQFEDGKRNGEGTYIWADGSKHAGTWKDDLQHGQGTYTSVNGSRHVGIWQSGVSDGQGTRYNPDGTLQGKWSKFFKPA